MDSKEKPMNEDKTIRDPIPEIKDGDLDAVAGGWKDGDPVIGNDKGCRHEGGGASGIWYTPYLTCPHCGGAIIYGEDHTCPDKRIKIR